MHSEASTKLQQMARRAKTVVTGTWSGIPAHYQQFQSLLRGTVRGQVALLIAGLSFVPNATLIIATVMLSPELVRIPLGLVLWIPILGILSAGVGYYSSVWMLRSLTILAKELSRLELMMGDPGGWMLAQRPQDPQEALILRGAFSQLLQQVRREQEGRAAFTATLMHDLKTPLVAFRHLLLALRDQHMDPHQQKDLLADLIKENERILELVQKMVEAHRAEREKIDLHLQPCDLLHLAQNLANRLAPVAQETGIQLNVIGAGQAQADPSELERALYNIVDNALHYAQSRVTIELQAGQIWVTDDGPGLPAPLEQLAQPYRGEAFEIAGQRLTARSTGLGLFIARSILEAHGGSLEVIATGATGSILALKVPVTE
jgi:signal transduction histidine kinase